jgi:hypothetical protein
MKNVVFCDVTPYGTGVSEDRGATTICVTEIGELGTTLAVTGKSQKTEFFIVTAVNTPNLAFGIHSYS